MIEKAILKSTADRSEIYANNYPHKCYFTNGYVESRYFSEESIIVKPKIRDGLILDMPFFEGSGTTAHDCANGNNGSISNCKWIKYGNRWTIELNQDTSKITIPSTATDSIADTDEFTITFWIYPLELPSVKKNIIINRGLFWIFVYVTPNTLGTFIPKTCNYYFWGSTVKISKNRWQFICFQVGNIIRVWKDGEVYSEIQLLLSHKFCKGYSTIVGKDYFNSLKCRIALLKIYNRYLYDEEVKEIYEKERRIMGV